MVLSVRYSIFWDVTQPRVTVVTGISVQPVVPNFEGQYRLLKIELLVCPETSIYGLDNIKVVF
jgi:hypothetical protein